MTFFGTNSWCANASLINLFDEIQKVFSKFTNKNARKKRKKKPNKEGKNHGRWFVTKCKGVLSKWNYLLHHNRN